MASSFFKNNTWSQRKTVICFLLEKVSVERKPIAKPSVLSRQGHYLPSETMFGGPKIKSLKLSVAASASFVPGLRHFCPSVYLLCF